MSNDPSAARPILEEDLHAFVDDALDASRRREVQAYLDLHPDAARDVAAHAAHRQELRALLAPISDEPVPPALNLQRLVGERRARERRPWGMAAAVLLALGVGGGAGWSLRGGRPSADAGIVAVAREATASYDVYASDLQRPVEMGPTQRAELVSWVSARLGRQVAVPDLAASGYRFIGGRLVATDHGPAGLFMYDDPKGTRLALLVRPMAVEKNTPMMEHIDGRFAGYAWADQGLGYGVVGTRQAGSLHALADEVRRQIGVDLKS